MAEHSERFAMDDLDKARVLEAGGRVFGPSPVFLAYAYGSRVNDTSRPDSDLDIGYYLVGFPARRDLSIRDEMLLSADLSAAIGLNVDLRDLGQAPLELRGRALEQGIRIYCCDEVARVNLERDLLGRYHDYKEEIAQMHRMRLQQFARRGLADG